VLWKRPSSDRCNSSSLHVDRRHGRRSFRMIYGANCPQNPGSDPGTTGRRKACTGYFTICRLARTIDRSSLRSLPPLRFVIPTAFGLPHPENPTSEAKWNENVVIIKNEEPVAVVRRQVKPRKLLGRTSKWQSPLCDTPRNSHTSPKCATTSTSLRPAWRKAQTRLEAHRETRRRAKNVRTCAEFAHARKP
jgi:hypothetical protein